MYWEKSLCISLRLILSRYMPHSKVRFKSEHGPKSPSLRLCVNQPSWFPNFCISFWRTQVVTWERTGPSRTQLVDLICTPCSWPFSSWLPGLPGTGTNPGLGQDHAGELIIPHSYCTLTGHQPQRPTHLVCASRTFPHRVWLYQESHHIYQVSFSYRNFWGPASEHSRREINPIGLWFHSSIPDH